MEVTKYLKQGTTSNRMKLNHLVSVVERFLDKQGFHCPTHTINSAYANIETQIVYSGLSLPNVCQFPSFETVRKRLGNLQQTLVTEAFLKI